MRPSASSVPAIRHRLQAFGDGLKRRQDVVRGIQWGVVALYAFLLVAPVAAPNGVLSGLARFSEALFWGVWWPGVILATLLFGQFWCGLLCPDGTLTEFASRCGRGGKIPPWLRRAGWPLLGFAWLTVCEQLTAAHHSPRATLLLLGGASLLALLTGLLVGRGKRVWCRYLCPLSAVFSLLSRYAVLHFRVDRAVWDAAPRQPGNSVDCPLLLDVRRLRSNEKCSMCGRCSGHRGAVRLALRAPGSEIAALAGGEGDPRRWEALAIVFGLVGLCYGALHWRGSVWHAALLALPAPGGVSAAWAVGAALLAILLPAAVIGGSLSLALLAVGGTQERAVRLAYGLIPLAGVGLLLGSLEYSLAILEREGVRVAQLLPALRALILAPALFWSARLGWLQLRADVPGRLLPGAALAIHSATLILLAACYQFAPSAL